jgi:hypothetical protein
MQVSSLEPLSFIVDIGTNFLLTASVLSTYYTYNEQVVFNMW